MSKELSRGVRAIVPAMAPEAETPRGPHGDAARYPSRTREELLAMANSGHGLTWSEVAAVAGIDAKEARDIHTNAIAKIRRAVR